MKTVAEGVKTAKATRELARKHGIEMPVVEEVHRILYEARPETGPQGPDEPELKDE